MVEVFGWLGRIREEKKELKEKFCEDLETLLKIINGGCPKINVITEIFEMKKKWGV